MSEEFSKFLMDHRDEISEIQRDLSIPMETEGNALASQLVRCESQYARLTTLRAYSGAFLDGATNEAWRTMKGTVPEREAAVKSAVAMEKRLSEVLDGLCRAITQRISLGQSILRKCEQDRPR